MSTVTLITTPPAKKLVNEPALTCSKWKIEIERIYAGCYAGCMVQLLDFAAMGNVQIEPLARIIDQSIRSQVIRQGRRQKKRRINLWLMDGHPLIGGKETEIIVSKFEFVPSPK